MVIKMANAQTINGITITQAQLAQLQAKGVNVNALSSMSAMQLSALLSGGSVPGFGALTAAGLNTNMLASMLSGNRNLTNTTLGMNAAFTGGSNMNAAQAIQMFEQMSGGYLTQSGLDLSGIISQTGGYNFGAANLAGLSSSDQKFMQNMSIASMALDVVGSLFGKSNANSANPLAAQAFNMILGLLSPSEKSNHALVVDASIGLPKVNTGLISSVDNAINQIQTTGKVTPEITAGLNSAKSSLSTLDSQIGTLESEVANLKKQESGMNALLEQTNSEEKNIKDIAKQEKLDKYQQLDATYTDLQATADKLKSDYEMTPDTITDKNGQTVKNPQKEVVKKQYEEAQKEAAQVKAQRDAMRKEIDNDPQLKSIADKTDQVNKFKSNFIIKSQVLNDKKEFRKTLASKISTLEQLTAKKSGGTSTD